MIGIVSEPYNDRSVFLWAKEPDAKLAKVIFAACKYFTISAQEARMMASTLNLFNFCAHLFQRKLYLRRFEAT